MLKDYQIKRIKEQYPKGTEIELISMEDSQAVPSGTHGVVDFVDDMGTIQMTWDNGSSLGLIVGEDQFKVIKKPELEIKELTCSEVKELQNRNYEFLILQGCGGDLSEWVDGFTKMLKDEGIAKDSFSFDEVYSFQNENLTNIAFALNNKDLDLGKLAMFRLKIRETFGAMWLSDYIDNGYIKDIGI